MIFKIHYFSFNAGLSGVLVLITVFLRKYSDASSTEVGTLLMILPFVAVFTKPFFCALADRHRKYRLYFILSLVFTLLGFGSYTILPFYPQFIISHGRLAWYLLVAATIVGYIAYGVAWSLGDAFAANVAHRTGESFGLIRLWGTVGWGVAGAIVGAVSPHLQLPEMVLGFLIFIVTHVFEIILLAWWPKASDFEMGDEIERLEIEAQPEAKLDNTSSIGCCCNVRQLATLDEKPALEKEAEPEVDIGANICLEFNKQQNDHNNMQTLSVESGQMSIERTKSNSLAITTKFKLHDEQHQASVERSISELIARCNTVAQGHHQGHHHGTCIARCGIDIEKAASCKYDNNNKASSNHLHHHHQATDELKARERKQIADLQMIILKLVAQKHKSLIKYLIIFVALGAVYNVHWSFFFLHLEQLASTGAGNADFSTLVGSCLVAQAVGETFCFIIAPWVVKRLGRDGAISLNAITYAIRYFGNGLGIPLISPHVAIVTESLQGINYGIFYYLITDTALHYALCVDDVIPELQRRNLLPEKADLQAVRTSLRATMQGVFSGAFDGLGFGLGSLVAGLVLETHTYEQLWCFTGSAAAAIFVVHAIYELSIRLLKRSRVNDKWRTGSDSSLRSVCDK